METSEPKPKRRPGRPLKYDYPEDVTTPWERKQWVMANVPREKKPPKEIEDPVERALRVLLKHQQRQEANRKYYNSVKEKTLELKIAEQKRATAEMIKMLLEKHAEACAS